MAQLAEQTGAAQPFGRYVCDMPHWKNVWVQFKTYGYQFKLRQQWFDAQTDRAVLDLLLPHVQEWNMLTVTCYPIDLPDSGRTSDMLDDVDEAVVLWLIRTFWKFWRTDLMEPPKNG